MVSVAVCFLFVFFAFFVVVAVVVVCLFVVVSSCLFPNYVVFVVSLIALI